MSRTSFGKIVASPALLDWTPRGSNEPQHPLFISATSFLSLFHLRVSFIPNIPSWHVPDRFRVHSGIPTLFGVDPEGMKCTPTPSLFLSHTPDIPSWHVPDRFRVHGGISRALILDPKGTKLTPTPPSISQPYLCLALQLTSILHCGHPILTCPGPVSGT